MPVVLAPLVATPAPPPARRTATRPAAPPITRTVRWAFLLYVASLAFEIPQRSFPFEVPTVTASLLLIAAGLSPRSSFHWIPRPLVWFIAYLLAFVAAVTANGVESPSRTSELFLLVVQALLIFWVACNVLAHPSIARAALWTYALACTVSAALPMAGIGRTVSQVYTGGERLSMFGQNPNRRALILAVGLLILIGLAQRHARERNVGARARFLLWLLVGIAVAGVVQTGSRVGLLATGVGLLVYALSGRTLKLRLKHTGMVLVAMAGLFWATDRSEGMRHRLRPAEGIEKLSGRERIFPAAWTIFQDRPGLGWGPINNQYEIALRMNDRKYPSRDTHNLLLELLTATGLAGTAPFLVGVALCLGSAWRARRGSQGHLPLALAATVLVAGVSANLIATKLLWLVLAYGCAAGSLARREQP